jgi:hypothetical protein
MLIVFLQIPYPHLSAWFMQQTLSSYWQTVIMNYAYRSDDEIIDDIDFVRKYNNAMSSQNETIHALLQT